MIGLLAPLFLLGTLAVAVPILVHLVHRERKQPLAFPSLMFLRRVPFRSAKRQRIRYWLLFLLRSAALMLVVAAFARPWLESAILPSPGAAGGKDIVLLLDRSYSMSARGVWAKAQRAAEQAIADAEHGDRIAIIAFGEQAQLLARLDEPRTRAQVAVQGIEPGADVTRYAPAFKLAGSALNRSRGPAEIIVITDRQRSGWRGMEQVAVPANTTVRVIDVSSPPGRNLALSEVTLSQSQSQTLRRQRVVPAARVLNRGAAAATVPVELRIDGRVQQVRQVAVPAHGATAVRFDAMFTDGSAGEVRIAAHDDVAADDVAFFTTDLRNAPVVRLVSNPDAAFFFANALTAGDESAFELHRSGTRLGAGDIADSDVVVFLDVSLPAGVVAQRLAEFVRQGGGVIVAGTVARQPDDLLPVRGIAVRESEATPASLVSIDAAHPIFTAFRAAGDEPFAAARITRHLRSEAVEETSVLARFDDGTPALVERRLGRGRILFFATSFSRSAGDLVLQPAFVPFAQQLVAHAAAAAHSTRAFTVGQVVDVNAFAPADADAVVITPGQERVRIAPATGARTLRIAEPGIYQIRGAGQGARPQLIAANVDVAESDFSLLPAEQFNDAVMPGDQAPAEAGVPLLPLEQEQRQSVWWYLLLIAFGLFLIETLLANRISTAWRT